MAEWLEFITYLQIRPLQAYRECMSKSFLTPLNIFFERTFCVYVLIRRRAH
jgi:hypothetical protein